MIQNIEHPPEYIPHSIDIDVQLMVTGSLHSYLTRQMHFEYLHLHVYMYYIFLHALHVLYFLTP